VTLLVYFPEDTHDSHSLEQQGKERNPLVSNRLNFGSDLWNSMKRARPRYLSLPGESITPERVKKRKEEGRKGGRKEGRKGKTSAFLF
jgi:hypothetical protein